MRLAPEVHHVVAGRTLYSSVDFLQPLAVGAVPARAAVCLLLLMYRFFGDLFALVLQTPQLNWHDIVTGVLNLVDLALTANLVLIVIFSSYENFIRRINAADHPDWPDGLTQVDFGELKQKLLGSVVGIAAVDALAWYFDLEKDTDTSKLGWVLGFPLVFAVVMLILADLADRLGRRPQGRANCRRGAGEGLLTIPGVNRTSAFGSNGVGLRVCGSPALSCCLSP